MGKVKVRKDLTGMKFGRLKVLRQAEDYINPSGVHYAQYECECDCKDKTHIIVTACHLKDGHTQSCGCLNIEAHIKHNKYDLSGNYGIGYTSNGEEFYFDLEDYDKIKDYTWYSDKDGYIVSSTNGKHTKMHRLVMNAKEGFDIDHVGMHDTRNDNRKLNLRECTRAENCRNKVMFSKNTSGCIGVMWDNRIKKWVVRITVDGNEFCLGSFENKEDAINARINGEKEYFKEFAPQREVGNIEVL